MRESVIIFRRGKDKCFLFRCAVFGCGVQHGIVRGKTCNAVLYRNGDHDSKHGGHGKGYDRFNAHARAGTLLKLTVITIKKGSQVKIERLYAITVYLLNHGRTSANELAKRFEVSQRTIQRDIDSLCLAGIPVAAVAGAAGGYEISETYRLNNGFATSDDYAYILTALRGLVSATGDAKAGQLLEKIAQASDSGENGMILDLSVLREGEQNTLRLLKAAADEKRTAEFTYTNNDKETRTHSVEPIAVLYRWYAWYLLAYSRVRQDYRTYKLVRMSDLKITDAPFTKEHAPADEILKLIDRNDSRQYTEVRIKCKASAKARVIEYLKGTVEEEFLDGGALVKATVVENEQFWLGTLLSLGDQVEILAPEKIRRQLLESAEKIVSLYK